MKSNLENTREVSPFLLRCLPSLIGSFSDVICFGHTGGSSSFFPLSAFVFSRLGFLFRVTPIVSLFVMSVLWGSPLVLL